jgi:WS/DGAT/MGAT family acyltransferase
MPQQIELLSPIDNAWLSMDEPTNLMVVNAILTFDKPVDLGRIRAVLQHRWLRFERFRQRIVRPGAPFLRPYWQTDATFSLDNHLHVFGLPSPGDRSALQELISDLMSTPIDLTKPPWHFYIFENYGGGSAIMGRIHHAVADGMALVGVLLSMTDFYPDAPLLTAGADASSDAGSQSLVAGLAREMTGALDTVRRSASWLVGQSTQTLQAPSEVRDLFGKSADTGLAAGRLLLREPDPPSLFKGKLGVMKRVAWSRPLPLDDVKFIKNHLGGTVNDVLITAVTGGLRRYLVERGQAVDGLTFRAAVPVNMRANGDVNGLGNKFGLVFLKLPVGVAEPLLRLVDVRQRMDELKQSAESPVTLGVLTFMGLSADAVKEMIVRVLEPKATAVMTNVPGPPIPLYLAGQEIKEIMFWVPQAGRLGLGVSILSYAGKIFVGVATDAGLVPDPGRIIDGFHQDFADLLRLARAVNMVRSEK